MPRQSLTDKACNHIKDWIIQRFNILISDLLAEAHGQHMEIFQALCTGDPRQAEVAMRRHMKATTRALIARLRDRSDILHEAIVFDPKKWSKAQ